MIQKEETGQRSVTVKMYVVFKPWCLHLLAIGPSDLCARVSREEDIAAELAEA